MIGNVEQYASGAGREALGFIKRIHSWAVSFYRCTQMVVGNPSVIGPMLLNCAGVCLARAWGAICRSHKLIWSSDKQLPEMRNESHIRRMPRLLEVFHQDGHPDFPNRSLEVSRAASRSLTQAFPNTATKTIVWFLNNALGHFRCPLLKIDIKQEVFSLHVYPQQSLTGNNFPSDTGL